MQEVVEIVGNYFDGEDNAGCAEEASKLLVREAQRRWRVNSNGQTCDDVTAVVVLLSVSRFFRHSAARVVA